MKNGSYIRFDCRKSGIWFSFERLSGSDYDAVLSLRIPKADWSAPFADEIPKVFQAHEFEYFPEQDSHSLLGIVNIPVDDIWAKSSGSRGAYAARLFLDTIGHLPSTKFKASEIGRPSRRALDDKNLFDKI
jgi:hypothetical protein